MEMTPENKAKFNELELDQPASRPPVIVSIRSMLRRAGLFAQLQRKLARQRRRSKWKRPPEERADGTLMNRREKRMMFIRASQLQGVEIAARRRQAYVQRRTNRWRGVVENNMPRMFDDALKSMGL